MAPNASDQALAKQSRRAGLTIAGTMLVWMLLQLIGAEYNWPPKYALLVDLFALAGFIWALAMVVKIWRARRSQDRP
jgi:type VI protein secretion system component VasK